MEKIILKELSKKMKFRYKIILNLCRNYTIYIFAEGTKIGFNWNGQN